MIYDFIVVGSGPAGAVIASRLARTPKAPKVLLLEAGGKNTEDGARVLADRYSTFTVYPHYNWGYTSAPQKHLNGQSINYSRGRGLGGSSAINFACYTVGPSGDYDHWAEIVGDEAFNWRNAKRRYDEIETFDSSVDEKYRKYMNPTVVSHGQNGPLHVCWPKELGRIVTDTLDTAEANGIRLNPDINSGDPIGIGLGASTAKNAMRWTSATAFLQDPPENLTILTDAVTTKILFDGRRAVGVVAGGKEYKATREVVLSAGAIDSPKLLLLSGIGPEAELAAHEIDCIYNLPGVGKNLQDHWWITMTVQLKAGSHDRAALLVDPAAVEAARAQFFKDGTGPLSTHWGAPVMAWLRPSDTIKESAEFKDLAPEVQRRISNPTVPVWELIAKCVPLTDAADAGTCGLTFSVVGMIPQSRGSITLASSNPTDAPISDPNLFSHPFDRRNTIEAIREAWALLTSPSVAADTESVFKAPKSMSEEDISDFAKETMVTTFHMSCTAKMGNSNDEMACVDTRFKVRGVEGLRVADMSVTPFLPNCHTMSVAYQIGATAAEKLIEEYRLDE